MIKRLTLALAVALAVAACSPTPVPAPTTTTSPVVPASSSTTTATTIDYVAYVEDALDFIEEYHYRGDEFDWVDIRFQALRFVEAYPSQTNATEGVRGAALTTDSPYISAYLLQADRRPDTLHPAKPPAGRRLANGIGYLDFAVGHENLESFVGDVRRLVEFIDRDPACGWVIDLRETPIGDLPSQIAALNPILGQGVVFGIESGDHREWTVRDGVVFVDGIPAEVQAGPDYAVQRPDAPVAVLISGHTGRASTFLAVAFEGRRNTSTFGQPTGASTLAYERLVLPDGAQIDVPSGASYDRLGRRYESIALTPDQTVLVAPHESGDSVLDSATTWIAEHAPQCTAPPATALGTSAPIDYVDYVEVALDFIEANHMRTDDVDWATVREETLAIVKANPTATGAYGAIERTFAASATNTVIPDPHSWFWRPERVNQQSSPDAPVTSEPPSGSRLDGGLGYSKLPSVAFGMDQFPTYAEQVRSLMRGIESDDAVCGWVIDLRDHTAGNSIVGLAGLGPLLGDEVFFRFVGNEETVAVSSYGDGAVLYDDEAFHDPLGGTAPYEITDDYTPHDPAAPVAVLTSTSTSGLSRIQ